MLMPPATIIAFLPSVACEEWRTHRSFSRSGSGATPKGRTYECEPGKGKAFVDLDRSAEPELPFEACGHSGSGYVISVTYELANRSTVGALKGRLFAYIVCSVPMFVRESLLRRRRRKVCQGQAFAFVYCAVSLSSSADPFVVRLGTRSLLVRFDSIPHFVRTELRM